MVREILVWPHPTLKQKALPVTKFDDSVRELVKDMFESMNAADGVGLAAPQIGVLKRVIVLDTSSKQPELKPVAMINPEILNVEGSFVYKEGCLSVPGEAEDVERAAKVTVRYHDENGEQQTMTCEGLLATAVQHETDHLNGVMFVDHISALKREVIRKKMKKIQSYREEKKERRESAAEAR